MRGENSTHQDRWRCATSAVMPVRVLRASLGCVESRSEWMGKNVFANGREVSAAKDTNVSLGAMPDVCLSPPTPPAGPIPIPYPNFSKASDTNDGTRTVQIGGGQVSIKNSSNYKSSNGDEAATKTLGMGVMSHQIQNTTYFAAWSFDVKFEGQNAVRQLDMTTHNNMK